MTMVAQQMLSNVLVTGLRLQLYIERDAFSCFFRKRIFDKDQIRHLL